MNPLTDKQREFFTRLNGLFTEYNASLAGCGCCGSPSIEVAGASFDVVNIDGGRVTAEYGQVLVEKEGAEDVKG